MSQGELVFPTGRPAIDEGSLSEDERTVLRALRWGRAGAVTIAGLEAVTGIGGRKVQEIVRTLREDHAVPIGTAMGRPFGNYLIDDPKELAEVFALFRARGLSNLKQAAALRGQSLRRYLAEVQTELGDVA